MSDVEPVNYWGSFVLSFRRLHSLTQDQLAERLKVSQQTVSRWEAGQQIPDPRSQSALRSVLGEADLNSLKIWKERIRRASGFDALLDAELRIVCISGRIAETFDMDPEGVVGRPISEFFPADRPRFMEQALERGFFKGTLSGAHYRVTVNEGRRSVFFDINLWPALTSDAGIFMHVVANPIIGTPRPGRDSIEVADCRFDENTFVGNEA
jgi:transcriptional regulator with XRE-family HTH domain